MPKRGSDEREEADDSLSSVMSHKRQKLDEDINDIKDQIENALTGAEEMLECIEKDSRPKGLSYSTRLQS